MPSHLPKTTHSSAAKNRPSVRRAAVAALVSVVALAVLVTLVIYARTTTDDKRAQSDDRPGQSTPGHTTDAPEPTASGPATWTTLPPLPQTQNPIAYAKAVAGAVFDWDTTSGLTTTDYTQVLVVDADPSGVETNGLVTDLATYLPTDDAWAQLREYGTKQTIDIDRTYVPKSWETAKREDAGQIADGTVAITIEGTRYRTGKWLEKAQRSSHDVSFTAFVACQPAFDRCHILRLSQLDNPLR